MSDEWLSLPQRGSTYYYSLLYVSEPQKQAIIILNSLYREFYRISAGYKDIGVTRVKLHWWHDEIQRTYQGNAQHPLAKKLFSVINTYHLPQEFFSKMILCFENHIETNEFESVEALKTFISTSLGNLLILEAFILLESAPSQELQESLTSDLAYFLYLSSELRKSQPYFTKDILAKFKLNIDDLSDKGKKNQVKRLISYQKDSLKQIYQSYKEKVGADELRKLYPYQIISEIFLKSLKKLHFFRGNLCSKQINIVPIRKFIISWKIYNQNNC